MKKFYQTPRLTLVSMAPCTLVTGSLDFENHSGNGFNTFIKSIGQAESLPQSPINHHENSTATTALAE